MSYQVIARKYRPQTFADLTGQEHISRTLKNAIENHRLHHAYLFSGVRGTGKTTTARILAKCLNCHTGITSEPCLQCPSCLEIATGNSLDVIEIDAASNTGVDNVREVIVNSISIAPARDRYKVFIIDEVHMLSNQAFNALLKTLEEPPTHVVFMMATTELHKVPDTILSRCQQFDFRQIPVDKIFQRLREIADAEQVKISNEALREVARAGNGSLRDAQSALDQVISFSGVDISEQDVIHSLGLVSAKVLSQSIRAIAEQNTADLLQVVEELDANGHDLRFFTRELMAYLRHLLVIKAGLVSNEVLGISDTEIETLKKLAGKFSEEDLVRFFHLLTETEKQIKDSPQPRFQLEIGLVKIAHATRLRALDEVIQRLEELAENLRNGATPPALPTAVKVPAPPRPASPPAPARRTAPEPVASAPSPVSSMEEPPGFGDSFARYAPDEPEADEAPAPVPAAAKPAAAPRPAIVAGHEIGTLKMELEKRRKPLVVMALEEAQVIYNDGKVIATFASENTFSKRLRESGDLFREIGEQLFGQPLRIEVKLNGEAALTPAQESQQARETLLESVKSNPAVKMLLDTFRGEIVDVQEA
ncbi:MAG TPA: DNA polymerase III subunit gamma/tau [Blastocatellia bacterium]|nr:DNA polymerase III subunit gamma/tau [Blastocatellia bacterium]